MRIRRTAPAAIIALVAVVASLLLVPAAMAGLAPNTQVVFTNVEGSAATAKGRTVYVSGRTFDFQLEVNNASRYADGTRLTLVADLQDTATFQAQPSVVVGDVTVVGGRAKGTLRFSIPGSYTTGYHVVGPQGTVFDAFDQPRI